MPLEVCLSESIIYDELFLLSIKLLMLLFFRFILCQYSTQFERTALHWASSQGHGAMVTLLIDKKADQTIKNRVRDTFIFLATTFFITEGNLGRLSTHPHFCYFVLFSTEFQPFLSGYAYNSLARQHCNRERQGRNHQKAVCYQQQ